ncbi:MAG: GTPase HflX [Pygmaiobacter sp.]
MQYRLPRLAGLGASMSRQGGGGGGGGGARRGAGESKLEYDRRHVRRRIELVKEKLSGIEQRRTQTRRSRSRNAVPVIALVGYTNVGKSSLLNRICGSEVLSEDMLFATLDPTARKMALPSGQNVIFVDTVGFVSRLPHSLVSAFKSTLEEAKYADIILKVADASDPLRGEQLKVTDEVLAEIGAADNESLILYNKCDRLHLSVADGLCVSAETGEGLDALLAFLDEKLADRVHAVELLLPYDQLALLAPLRAGGSIETEEYREDGVYVKALADRRSLHLFEAYLLET